MNNLNLDCVSVVKEGAIKTITLEKTGDVSVSRDVFVKKGGDDTAGVVALLYMY